MQVFCILRLKSTLWVLNLRFNLTDIRPKFILFSTSWVFWKVILTAEKSLTHKGLIKQLQMFCFALRNHFSNTPTLINLPLFVFLINGPKQNARSLPTPISDRDFDSLFCGSLPLILYGSSKPLISNLLIGSWRVSTNRKMFKKLPWRAKPRLPC